MNSQYSAVSRQPSIQLHIERLVLEGLPVSTGQGPTVQAAMEAELTRLLTVDGLVVPSSRAERHLPAGHIHLMPEGSPRSLGQQIGDAVYHLLNQSEQQTTTNEKANTL